MNAFEDFDEDGFVDLLPAGAVKRQIDLRLAMFQVRAAQRLAVFVRKDVLGEIGGPRYDVAWNPQKRLLLVKSGVAARFEAASSERHYSARITVPLPAGLTYSKISAEPEFYVDVVGKRLLIEVPAEFGRRLALPAPAHRSAAEAPAAKPARISPEELEAGNREILRALGITESFPRELGGVTFKPAEARVLEALYRGKELTLEALLAATHDPADGDDERQSKLVDVWLCNMRPKLAKLDVAVKTIWGGKRSLDAASKGRLRELLREAGAEA